MNYSYFISRTSSGVTASVQEDDESGWPLPLRLDLFRHSPAGFEWGYPGSGPAQLALAILAHHFSDAEKIKPFESFVPDFPDTTPGDGLAIKLHQQFKFRVIALIPREMVEWSIASDAIDCVVIGILMPTAVVA